MEKIAKGYIIDTHIRKANRMYRRLRVEYEGRTWEWEGEIYVERFYKQQPQYVVPCRELGCDKIEYQYVQEFPRTN